MLEGIRGPWRSPLITIAETSLPLVSDGMWRSEPQKASMATSPRIERGLKPGGGIRYTKVVATFAISY
jgi:hypothetical protein